MSSGGIGTGIRRDSTVTGGNISSGIRIYAGVFIALLSFCGFIILSYIVLRVRRRRLLRQGLLTPRGALDRITGLPPGVPVTPPTMYEVSLWDNLGSQEWSTPSRRTMYERACWEDIIPLSALVITSSAPKPPTEEQPLRRVSFFGRWRQTSILRGWCRPPPKHVDLEQLTAEAIGMVPANVPTQVAVVIAMPTPPGTLSSTAPLPERPLEIGVCTSLTHHWPPALT
ncbi:hypothetical protein FISHEDRAFT_78108 [Fistulina hepatica ATCC 64428]|nr:hypothetical protein FISHEDRAFT_78108 [Fistulina hepatica ATCC 64428]